MKNTSTILFALLCMTHIVIAQEAAVDSTQGIEAAPKANTIYIEGFGHGLWYSVNYDRLISPSFSIRIGYSYIEKAADKGTFSSFSRIHHRAVPIAVNYLLGKKAVKLELGTGVVFISTSGLFFDDVSWKIGNAWGMGIIHSVVVRRQPFDGGFNFRFGLTPAWANEFFFWFGLSLGWTF